MGFNCIGSILEYFSYILKNFYAIIFFLVIFKYLELFLQTLIISTYKNEDNTMSLETIEQRITYLEQQNQLKNEQIKGLASMVSIFIDLFAEIEAYSDIKLETLLDNLSYTQQFDKLQKIIEEIQADT